MSTVNRKSILLLVLIAVGLGIAAYRYVEKFEEDTRQAAREAALLALKQAQEATRLSPQQQENLVSEAKRLLDEGDQLARARSNLERVLKSNRENASARIQMARYYIISGHLGYRNF